MSDNNLTVYAIVLGAGVIVGITLAEGWRRAALHDSYTNYLPDAGEGEDAAPDMTPASGPTHRAAGRLWSPIAASAKRDLARLRRRRTGAPKPTSEPTT
jgi:hypothetical protein